MVHELLGVGSSSETYAYVADGERLNMSGGGAIGGALGSQPGGCGFESRLPLQMKGRSMTGDELDLTLRMREVRQSTIRIYREMASLTDAAAAGYVPREPGAPDVTMSLIERALDDAPVEARRLLQQVIENDERIADLTRQLVRCRSAEPERGGSE